MKSGWFCVDRLNKLISVAHTKRGVLALCMATLSIAACHIASDPERIRANYIPPDTYQNYSCVDLAKRIVTLGYQIEDLHNRLSKRHKRDEWQLAFSWFYGISAAFIDGDDAEAEEFRHLQGEFEAARIQAVRKDCGFEAPTREGIYLKAKASLSTGE